MDRHHPADFSADVPAAPEALSHRQLQALLRLAPRDADHGPLEPSAIAPPGSPMPRLRQLLAEHEALSQAILEELSRQGDALQGSYTPPQLLALGALAAHLRLGLGALEASRR